MKDETFWLVWTQATTTEPTRKHKSLSAAEDEAKRLAAKFSGEMFYVLQVRTGFVVAPEPVQRITFSSPF